MGVWFTRYLKTKRWFDIEDTSDSIQGRYLPMVNFDVNSFKFITSGIYYTNTQRYNPKLVDQRLIVEQFVYIYRKQLCSINLIGTYREFFTMTIRKVLKKKKKQKLKLSKVWYNEQHERLRLHSAFINWLRYNIRDFIHSDMHIDIDKVKRATNITKEELHYRMFVDKSFAKQNPMAADLKKAGLYEKIPIKNTKLIFFDVGNPIHCSWCGIKRNNKNKSCKNKPTKGGICKGCKLIGFCSKKCQKKHHKITNHHYYCKSGRIRKANEYEDYKDRIIKELILFF